MERFYLLFVGFSAFFICIGNLFFTPSLVSADNRNYVPGMYDDNRWSQFQDPQNNQSKIIPQEDDDLWFLDARSDQKDLDSQKQKNASQSRDKISN